MITYTEEEIKYWFTIMKKEFQNSLYKQELEIVELGMFDNESRYSLKNILKKVDK